MRRTCVRLYKTCVLAAHKEGTTLDTLFEAFENRVLWAGLAAWLAAQGIKVLLTLVLQKRFDVHRLVGAGGMPSSHSAFVCAITTAIGFHNGASSSIFALSVCFTLIVMYDAAGVRRAAGRQAAVLNRILEDMFKSGQGWDEEKLKELIGHTPVQVAAGALLGVLVGILLG